MDLTHFQTLIGTDTEKARQFLLSGELVAMPTETVYGLAGNALDPAVVVKIFQVKNRPGFDPLIVHVPSLEAVSVYALEFPEAARRLAEHFWPGPLTLLLPRRDIIPDLVTSGLPRVALRMPAHPLAQALLRSLPFPLAAPSANPFGYISPTTAGHVFDQLQGWIPYILDGGACPVGVESTIVGFEDGDRPVLYRLGGLSVEAIEAVTGPVSVQLNQSSNPAAPGMLRSHYAPRKPLYLLHELATEPDLQSLVDAQFAGKRIACLCFSQPETRPSFCDVLEVLSPAGEEAEAAQHLFAALRRLDQSEADLILAEPAPERGLGRAINDRLLRAAAR